MALFTTSTASCTPNEERGSIVNAQGLKLATFAWRVENPKGVVLALHGYGAMTKWEFMGHPGLTYEGGTVEALNQEGFTVVSYDMQGFGESESVGGIRAYVDSFDDYVKDALQMHAQVKADAGPLPVYVLGESMGGCIAAHTVHALGAGNCDGCILTCPMLCMDTIKAENWHILPVLSLLDWIIPSVPIGSKAPNTKFPKIEEEFQAHPLTYKGAIRVRIGVEFIRASDEALAKAPEITCPILLLHSPDDVTCEFSGSEQFYAACGAEDKTLVSEPFRGMWHAVIVEPGKEKAFAEMTSWLKLRCGRVLEEGC